MLDRLGKIVGIIVAALLGLVLLVFGVGIGLLAFTEDFPWYSDLIVLAVGGGVAIGGVATLAELVEEARGPR
jgi:hypothetical protein